MHKYLFRFFTAVFVFFFFKLTKSDNLEEALRWHQASTNYMIYTLTVVMLLWEALDRSVSYFYKRVQTKNLEFRPSLIFFKSAMVCLPCVFLFAYIFNFHVIYWMPDDCCMEEPRFLSDAATGYVMGMLIIYYELTKLSTRESIKNAREKEVIQKELMAAKYEGLKNQVNPHFLFNSFSTLASLVEGHPKLAVEFIDKLSDLYRYVLEHDTDNLVSLQKELDFLNDYIFLLKIRHQDSISITNKMTLPLDKVKIPALSLQTLVENAVKHNAFSSEDPLDIEISNEGSEFITIKNLLRPKSNPIKTTKIGLKNLANRIQLTLKKELEILEDDSTFMVKLPINLS